MTGFFDWRDVGTAAARYRLRDNPSGRLLCGAIEDGEDPRPPSRGVLATCMDAPWRARVGVEVTFQVLPVLWGVSEGIPYDHYDVVIHTGLGVYDVPDRIVVERGAFHRREGLDVCGCAPERPSFAPGRELDTIIEGPAWLEEEFAALDGATVGGHQIEVKDARVDNIFLCNETHGRALVSLGDGAGAGGPLAAFFLHLPDPVDGDDRGLAIAVRALIDRLIRHVRAAAPPLQSRSA